MKFYKDSNERVFAFYPDDEIPAGMIEITEAQKDDLIAAQHSISPLEDWENKMRASDRIMSRPVEDIIAAIGTDLLPEATQAKFIEKTALRASKPDITD